MTTYKFSYPSKIESETKMLSDLIDILNEHKITGDLRNHIKVVVSEAFNNAILHGNKLDENKLTFLRIHINEKNLSADIIDQGRGGLKKVINKKQRSLTAEGGRGIDLIMHYANEYNYEEISTGGLKVSVQFDRKESKTIS